MSTPPSKAQRKSIRDTRKDDYELAEARIEKVTSSIAQLQDEKIMLQEQFERLVQRTSHLQNEINSRLKQQHLLGKDEGPRPEVKEEAINEKKERGVQEDMIKDELLRMLQERFADHKAVKIPEDKPSDVSVVSTQIHTVRVRYVVREDAADTDKEYAVYESTFRIGKNSSFERLIEEAKKLWVRDRQKIESLDMRHLRSGAFNGFDVPPQSYIEKTLLDLAQNPDLWIVGAGKGTGLDPQKLQATYSRLTEKSKDQNPAKKAKDKDKLNAGNADALSLAMMPYKGLNTMLPPKTASTKIAIGAKHKDTHCCTITFLLLLLILTAYIYASRANLQLAYDIHHGVQMALNKEFDQRCEVGSKQYSDIRTYDDLVQFVYYVLPNALYRTTGDTTSKLLDNYILIGGLMLRSLNTKEKTCYHAQDLPQNRICYENVYSSNTAETAENAYINPQYASVNINNDVWRKFSSSSQNDISDSFQGEFGAYEGSGYTMIFPDQNMDRGLYQNTTQYMLLSYFIGPATRAMIMSFNMYCPSLDTWAQINIVIEISTSNAVYPNEILTKVFNPNIFQSSTDKNLQVADIFRILFTFYIFYLFVFEVVVGKNNKPNIEHIYSFQGLMDLLMIASIFVAFGTSYSLNADTQGILKTNAFKGLGQYANAYFIMQQFNVVALILIILRILMFMRILPQINIILLTMQTAMAGFMTFLFVFLPLLVAMSLLTMSIWGTYMYEYHEIQTAIITNLLFYVGSGNTTAMISIDKDWSLVFFTAFFFLFLFFLLCEAIATFVEAYVNVRLSLGYEGSLREKNEDDEEEALPLTPKAFVRWLLEFLPVKWKVALFERDNKFGFDKVLSRF